MEKAELKLVELDNADIITTSGGGDGLFHFFNFGDKKNDAVFTYGSDDRTKGVIYSVDGTTTTKIVVADLVAALNKAIGLDNAVRENTRIHLSDDEHDINAIKFLPDLDRNSDQYKRYNGAYKWDGEDFWKVVQ